MATETDTHRNHELVAAERIRDLKRAYEAGDWKLLSIEAKALVAAAEKLEADK